MKKPTPPRVFFYFNFRHDNAKPKKPSEVVLPKEEADDEPATMETWGFELKGIADPEIWEWGTDRAGGFSQVLDLERQRLEDKYGIHDAEGDDSNPKLYLTGFNTYEVRSGQVLKLMKEWRKFFVSHFGETQVGDLTDLIALSKKDKSLKRAFGV